MSGAGIDSTGEVQRHLRRRFPSVQTPRTELLGGLDGDEPARGFIMGQDREIAESRGDPR
jgi:hypothetical protein